MKKYYKAVARSVPWAVFAAITASGAEVAAPPPPPFKAVRYDEDYLYLAAPARRTDFFDPIKFIPLNHEGDWYLTLGGEVRERYEYFDSWNWGEGPQDHNGYLLQRYMIHADAHFRERFRIFTQLKSNLEDGRNGGPRFTDEDQLDLHQLFLDGKLRWEEKDSFTLRLGRQEMSYGSSRLVSLRESPNVRRSFDGARGILMLGDWRVDVFAVKPVEIEPGIFDDVPNHELGFWGIYGVRPVSLLPDGHMDLYYLGLDRQNAEFDQGTALETRHSIGTRIWGAKQGWDYNFEFVYQFGTFGDGDISAWTAASDTGYTFADAPLKPRLALKVDLVSGDSDPSNKDLGTFNPLFPRNSYFGEPSLITPANIIDAHPYIELHPTERITLTVDWDVFWRESTRDGVYGAGVVLVRSSGTSRSSEIGSQVQALVEWQVQRHITISAVYAHFFAGDFLRETGPGNDVNYFSTWITFKF